MLLLVSFVNAQYIPLPQTSFNVSPDAWNSSAFIFYDYFIDSNGSGEYNGSKWTSADGLAPTTSGSEILTSYLNFTSTNDGWSRIKTTDTYGFGICMDFSISAKTSAANAGELDVGRRDCSVGADASTRCSTTGANGLPSALSTGLIRGGVPTYTDSGADIPLYPDFMDITLVINKDGKTQIFYNNSGTNEIQDAQTQSTAAIFSILLRDDDTYLIKYFIAYNCSLGFPTIPVLPLFSITAKDEYDREDITNFTVTIFNSTDRWSNSTTTGLIHFANLTSNNSGLYNITFTEINDNGGYISRTFPNINVSKNFEASLYQAILYVNASEVLSGNQILNFNITFPLKSNVSNSTGWATFFISSGNHDYIINADGYMTTGGNLSISALETKFLTVEFGTANLTVKAFTLDGTVINDFNATINFSNRIERQETNDGSVVFNTIVGTYRITMDSANYALDSKLITITSSDRFPNVSFYLFTRNSINITIFDEETNKIIDDFTSTLVFDHESLTFTNTTADGTFYIDNLLDGLWSIVASTSEHFQRKYFFTVTTQSHTFLNIYLLNTSNGEEKLFNIKNKQDQAISGALITVSNKINSSYITVAQKYSDFGGQANIFLKSTNEYRFTINADGFSTKVFDLEPIQTDYNIILSSTEEISFTTIFEDLSYLIIPDNSVVNQSEKLNFSIIVSSPTGSLSYFGLNSSFNGIDRITNVSVSPSGGTTSITINLSNQSGSTVPIDYFIKINGQDEIKIHRDYYISRVITPGNYSAVSFADKYQDRFTAIMKAIIVVFVAVAVILTFSEVGVPAGISGMAGVFIMIGGAIINWIPRISVFILVVIIFGMFILRRGD